MSAVGDQNQTAMAGAACPISQRLETQSAPWLSVSKDTIMTGPEPMLPVPQPHSPQDGACSRGKRVWSWEQKQETGRQLVAIPLLFFYLLVWCQEFAFWLIPTDK